MTLYESTNRKSPDVDFRTALLTGQAPDRGLYTPRDYPELSLSEIEDFRERQYHETAFEVARKYLEGEVPEEVLRKITRDAYDFEVPLENMGDRFYVMRLDRGPTAAFKDFAARMMSMLMQHFLKEEGRDLLILTATSGDTGSAVANAFHGLENIRVVVLFPENEVTERQRKLMTTLGGNVSAVAVDGKFDDCQHLVKQAFSDTDLEDLNLSSANSINFGRLLPQSIYYVYAYSKLYQKLGEEIVFSVPSGNFGDLMGGMLAKKMGLPVSRFVVACNENDEFPNYLNTGRYEKVCPSRACISNAMNVGHPSNLARLFHVYGGWMRETGELAEEPDIQAMRGDLWAVSVTDEETRQAIREAYDVHQTILEPHGAVGWHGLKKYMQEAGSRVFSVLLETADPAKFPEEVEPIIGFDPPLPECMKEIMRLPEDYSRMKNSYPDLKKYLENM